MGYPKLASDFWCLLAFMHFPSKYSKKRQISQVEFSTCKIPGRVKVSAETASGNPPCREFISLSIEMSIDSNEWAFAEKS